MIFLDSWIWIEYFSQDEKYKEVEKVLEVNEKIVISTTVILEVKYRISKKFGIEKSENAIYVIENLPNIFIIPVSLDIAKLAADLRIKYYKTKEREISFIDSLHLATALLTGCRKLYSGDPDFKNIEEIETVII